MANTKLFVGAAMAAALAMTGACASSQDSGNPGASANVSTMTPAAPEPSPATSAETAGYSDAQLRAFAEASLEIDPISRGLAGATPQEQATAAEQIRGILERHDLDGATYNAIASEAQTDAELAARIAELQTGQEGAMPSDPDAMPDETTTPQ
jgi:hypothetical protein